MHNCLKSSQKFDYHILFRTEEEKDEWLDALYIAIKSYFERINTLNIGNKIVGKEEPKFEDLSNVNVCGMVNCVKTFGYIFKGRHCKACGKVRNVVNIYFFRLQIYLIFMNIINQILTVSFYCRCFAGIA